MRERHETEELTNTVSLGVLAEDVVEAAGRLLRQEALDAGEERALADAAAFLQGFGALAEPVSATRLARRFAPEEGHLALRAFRARASEPLDADEAQDIHDFIERLSDVFARARRSELRPEDAPTLELARQFFASLGELSLRRTQDLIWSRRRDQGTWTRLRLTSAS